MKKLLRTLREGNNMLNVGALTAAALFLLAGPCWSFYVWLLDLGPGGWGGLAEADTPAAHSIAEMESLDRFTLQVRGTAEAYYQEPYFFVDGETYWVLPLDSGEQAACRFTLDCVQREKRDGVYVELYPVGTWREWKLTGEERAGVERDAPQLSTTDFYIDMEGHHRENRTEGRFKAGFRTLCLVIGLGAIIGEGFRQDRKKKREADVTLPQNDLERWITGTYAIWGQFFAQLGRTKDGSRNVEARRGPVRIGGQPMDERGKEFTRETLKDSWEISNREELLETVEYMSQGPGFWHCATQADRAWQLCRSMQLLGMCFTAGWYSREEMITRSCRVGQRMQECFSSWNELCESFLEGYFNWMRRDYGMEQAQRGLKERREIFQELQSRPDSPYRLNWYFSLDQEVQRRRERQLRELEK